MKHGSIPASWLGITESWSAATQLALLERVNVCGIAHNDLDAVREVWAIMQEDAQKLAAKIAGLDKHSPGWRTKTHPNGQRMFTDRGMMLNDRGTRSIFDDVDE